MNIYGKGEARWMWYDRKEAEKRLGEYVWDNENWFCSNCGFHVTGRYGTKKFKYCPNCGKRMEDR